MEPRLEYVEQNDRVRVRKEQCQMRGQGGYGFGRWGQDAILL